MLLRIASALLLIPIVLALVFFAQPRVLLAALAIVGTLCLREYFQLTERMGLRGQPWFGYVAFWLTLVGLRQKYFPAYATLAALLFTCFIAAMWRQDSMRERVTGMMANFLGILYIALCLYPALPVRYDFGERVGLQWILVLLVVIWAGDVAALFVGRSLGRTLFSPRLSPNKTNEGALGGLAAGVIAAYLLQHFFFGDLPLKHVLIVSVVLGMVGQLGDLAESLLKRAAETKESSNLIPGHGGVLDRVDSLLFALPVLYVYLLRLYPS